MFFKSRFHSLFFLTLAMVLSGLQLRTLAADPPDVLTFSNGEKLIGHLIRAGSSSVTFHSDSVGDVTVDWSKIKELTAAGKFAVVSKGTKLKRNEVDGQVAHGSLNVTDQKIQVSPGSGQPQRTVAVANTSNVIDEAEFQKAIRGSGFFDDWKGGITAGVALVEATQTSQTFTGAIHLTRAEPTQDWLAPHDRTLFNFVGSYGKLDQPNTPTVKTEIYHLDAERDEYFSPRMFGFGQADFDHNFSQGLDLQQTYSAGIGVSVMKTAVQTLDLKGSISYISQNFSGGAKSESLIGSVFGEAYHRKLPFGIIFDQALIVTPSWNNTSAYSANGSAGFTMGLYKRLSLNVNMLDTFLNDPPPGFKKNSFQFTTGLTYTLP